MIKKGSCDFVLPKFLNSIYLKVPAGNYFGVIDIVATCMQEYEEDSSDDSQVEDANAIDEIAENTN